MIKYASNAFLATKISFINAIANLCEAVNADVREVALGMGYDPRIGFEFLHPGPGYGGSCFPKDTAALLHTAEEAGYDFSLLRGVRRGEPRASTSACVEKMRAAAGGSLDGRHRRGLGPHVQGQHRRPARLAGAGRSCRRLLDEGAVVRAYDPVAGRGRRRAVPGARGRRRPVRGGRRRAGCSRCSPSGTSSAGSTSAAWPERWPRRAPWSTPATCSTRRRCAAAASPTRASAADAAVRVVTGGAGFLGSHLCDALRARELGGRRRRQLPHRPARATSRTSPTTPGFTFVEHDVIDGHPRRRARSTRCCTSPARRARPSTSRTRSRRSTVGSIGTRHALDLARAHGARFLLASTSEIYGDPLVHPQPESYWGNVNSVGPRSVYDEAKRYAEALTMAYHRELRRRHQDRAHLQHLRPAPRPSPTAGWCRTSSPRRCGASRSPSSATARRPARSATSTTRCAGILGLLDSDHVGPMNIGNPDEFTMLELAELVLEVTGSRRRAGVRAAARPTIPKQRRPDITLAAAVLGWHPEVDLREGLARTHDWYRRHGGISLTNDAGRYPEALGDRPGLRRAQHRGRDRAAHARGRAARSSSRSWSSTTAAPTAPATCCASSPTARCG